MLRGIWLSITRREVPRYIGHAHWDGTSNLVASYWNHIILSCSLSLNRKCNHKYLKEGLKKKFLTLSKKKKRVNLMLNTLNQHWTDKNITLVVITVRTFRNQITHTLLIAFMFIYPRDMSHLAQNPNYEWLTPCWWQSSMLFLQKLSTMCFVQNNFIFSDFSLSDTLVFLHSNMWPRDLS